MSWTQWLSTRSEAEREAAIERVAIMVEDGGMPEWLARAHVMGLVRMANNGE